MNLRCQSLTVLLLTGGLLALSGCARNTPARVELGPADKASVAAGAPEQTPPASRNGRFTFPADQGGPLLRDLLGPPSRLASEAEAHPGPRPQPVPREVASPELPSSAGQAPLPRGPLDAKGKRLQPYSPAEEMPLANHQADPKPTSRQEMRGGAPIWLPSRDVDRPPALPLLGVLTVDRAPLEDPTVDDSARTALAAPPPLRVNPAPFAPRNLPDPFENGQAVKLRGSSGEEQTPANGPVRPPKN